ncbi:hypothetical protein K469DRAFT_768687 [Zopfia rhizophila CBS 207.26]|uniref:Glucose receptor Git3-like N-terminal domain-containing protein n=1 Tax=Zopfia rhizophila CBS 207.26 TaxID=1314779 RepID=A0A6A6EAN0_9PEZI|nr:hypothetical protein K469DRAFT_768687 [Zopfia rhizophila CBS 207.26]
MPGAGKRNLRIVSGIFLYIFIYPRGAQLHILLSLLPTNFFFSRVSASPIPTPKVATPPVFNSSNLYAKHRKFIVQVAAMTCAAISMVASFTTFYWFSRKEKLFRHRLIMFLIYGDLTKATWLFLFSVVSIARGIIPTESAFCWASGFLLCRVGDCDHSALQVFRPSTLSRSHGLHPFRYYIYFGAFIIPSMMSGLAFINPLGHTGIVSPSNGSPDT